MDVIVSIFFLKRSILLFYYIYNCDISLSARNKKEDRAQKAKKTCTFAPKLAHAGQSLVATLRCPLSSQQLRLLVLPPFRIILLPNRPQLSFSELNYCKF